MSASSPKGNWLIFFIYAVFKHIKRGDKKWLIACARNKKAISLQQTN